MEDYPHPSRHVNGDDEITPVVDLERREPLD